MLLLPRPLAAALLVGMVLSLGGVGWLASGASAGMISPMTGVPVGLGLGLWFLQGGAVIVLLQRLALPRLVSRLTLIGAMSVGGWALGTLARALWVTLAFASAETVEVRETVELLLPGVTPPGDGTTWRSTVGGALGRSVSLPFDAEAAERIGSSFACVAVRTERTPSGVERVVVPEAPLGVADLVGCPGADEEIAPDIEPFEEP